jgi:hypothetical protein
MQKGILSLIVSALDGFLDFDRVDDRGSWRNVHHFHKRVIDRIKGSEQIQVSSDKYQEKELMWSNRNTYPIDQKRVKKWDPKKYGKFAGLV